MLTSPGKSYYQCINMTARPLLFHVVQKRLENRAEAGKETDWRIGLSSTTVSMIDACVAAARDCTTMMVSASKQNLWGKYQLLHRSILSLQARFTPVPKRSKLETIEITFHKSKLTIVATFGFMDGEHAFSAALVLVMVNIAFAINPRDSAAMDQAMSVLQGMAEKGNGHIRSRYQLLKNLQSMIHTYPDSSRPTNSTQDPSNPYPDNTAPQASPISSSSTADTPPPHNTSSNLPTNPTSTFASTSISVSNPNPSYEPPTYAPIPFNFATPENNTNNNNNEDHDIANLIPFEAYENLDYMNMDIDWTLWTAEAARSSED